MNLEQSKQFEQQLREIKPVASGSGLATRVEAAIRKSDRVRRIRSIKSVLSWSSLAVAASILITFGFLLFNGRLVLSPSPKLDPADNTLVDAEPLTEATSIEAEDEFQAILAENTLQGRIDEGIVFLRNGLTARRYRYEFIDRVVWQNPVDGATVEMRIPRDEVILIPVQTF